MGVTMDRPPRSGFPEQPVDLLFICVVIEDVVKLGASLHLGHHALLRAVAADGSVDIAGSVVHRPKSRQRIQRHGDSDGMQFRQGEEGRLAELGQVGQHRHGHGGGEFPIVVERGERLGEYHIGPGGDIGLGAGDGGGHAFNGRSVGACHNDKFGVGPSVNGGLEAVAHLRGGNEFLARAVTAAFGGDLVFDVHCGYTGPAHLADGAGNVECVSPAGIDVDEERQGDGAGDSAGVCEDVVKAGHAEIGQPIGGVGDSCAGEIEGAEAGALGEQRGKGIDGACDLQRLLGGKGSAETRDGKGAHDRKTTKMRVTVSRSNAGGHVERGAAGPAAIGPPLRRLGRSPQVWLALAAPTPI